MPAAMWGRILRTNRQVCDLIHGGPTAKRHAAFLRCKMTQLALSGHSSCARVCPHLDQSGQKWILAQDGLSAYDPTATLAVHCGNGFDAGFSPYQSTRLSRYNAGSLAWGERHATARVHYAYRLSASRQRNDCGVTKYIGPCRSYWRGFNRCRTYSKVPRWHRRPGARPGLLASRAGPTSGNC